ncbi:hypothetical protein AYL99_10325 [Fonsecaea erecta]|uniref:Uncharacterized protein n=1 Tax=Fonsecaea erecta TaxID=1367422 RepID=A0A178Z6M7_9EURO|nr:hypothetical protein AYL99_10325 [Fonsecaea erecta]OAP55352.1 hypothetical protein AYL99_10325 [Fonsecaea erecta]
MCEDLLVGDDSGKVYYYSVEWPDFAPGCMTMLAKLDAHSQNICGLAWSPDGTQFVTGGNDNRALLFDPSILLHADAEGHVSTHVPDPVADTFDDSIFSTSQLPTPPSSPQRYRSASRRRSSNLNRGPVRSTQSLGLETPPPSPSRRGRVDSRSPTTDPLSSRGNPHSGPPQNASVLRNRLVDPAIPAQAGVHVHSFYHAAAVKAIAFAPWQPNLLATGGGSNDRQIHFFHTGSGALLALINVFSQVTSLV